MPEPSITGLFGASVRSLRFQLGLTQEALAERADLHRTYIAGIERGARNVTLKSIDKLARALEVSVATLLSPSSKAVPEAGPPLVETATGRSVDILIVEDNLTDLDLALQAFKKAKITNPIHVVYDGAEALDFLFCTGQYSDRKMEQRPQIVLLDLNLPKISGLEVLRRTKANQRTSKILVVVLTSSQHDRDIAECRRLGVQNYIVKPVDFCNFSKVTPQLRLRWTLLEPAIAPRL